MNNVLDIPEVKGGRFSDVNELMNPERHSGDEEGSHNQPLIFASTFRKL